MPFYARHDDDLCQTNAHTVTASAADPEYPAVNLTKENAAQPAKLTTTSGHWVIDFAAPTVGAVAAALIFQYLDQGLDVRLQFNDTDSWGSPARTFNFTIPAKRRDGPDNQRWTNNVLLRLDTDPEDLPDHQFMRLLIAGTNSQPVAVGRLMLLETWRAVDLFHDGGGDIAESDDAGEIVHPTELGVETIYVLGGPRRSASGVVIGTDLSAGTAPAQGAADFRALHESSEGRAHPFLFLPFVDRDPWLVRFESAQRQRAHRQGGYQVWPFDVREVSRGLPWP